ncbi:MAG: 16S rRNA (uracil(1498)-N(3))-methyltransferase [Clostridia bacterium]
MPKFYILDSIMKKGEALSIPGEEARHIARSLRMRKGDTLTVCDGRGNNFLAGILEISKDHVHVEILRELDIDNESSCRVRLFIAMTKGDKMEYAIQKCVELGVFEIIPVTTRNTVVHLNTGALLNRSERWNKIALEAAKQSGRSLIPQVQMPVSFAQALEETKPGDLSFMAYLGEDRMSLREFLKGRTPDRVNIFIGPEGGFTKDEDRLAREKGVRTVHLGPRVLKTETAAIFTVGTVMYALGDLDKTPCSIP